MRQQQAFSAFLLITLGAAVAAAQSFIGVGPGDPPPVPATATAPHRVIGVPLSATSQPGAANPIGPLQAPPVNVAPGSGLTRADALLAVHAMALAHPNPDVRAAADHAHDDDWSVNVELESFSLILHEPVAHFVAGSLTRHDGVNWKAEFNDNESLAKPWTPPATESLTLEQSRALLADMCAARAAADPAFRRAGEALKAARPDPASTGGETVLRAEGSSIIWKINAQERTFSFTESTADAADLYTGALGWDKNKSWTAWPITHAHMSAADATHPQVNLMIPGQEKPVRDIPAPATAPQEGDAGNKTFRDPPARPAATSTPAGL